LLTDRSRSVAVLALVIGLGGLCSSASSAQTGTVAIAGLLGGNTLVPLGQFVAGRWVRTWPAPNEQIEIKIGSLGEIPRSWYPIRGGIPKEWFLWTDEILGVPVRVKSPALVEAHCQAVWGLATRLAVSGHETTAIATSIQSGVRPFGFSTVWPGGGVRLGAFLREQFDSAEVAAIRTERKDADALLKQRPTCDPVYMLNCVSLADGDHELCSFEASRPLGTKPNEADAECLETTVVQGWFKTTADGPTLLQISGVLTDCDAKELRNVQPSILIEIGGHTFVVAREHGYEDESFSVFELRAHEVTQVLKMPGGGC
jgi:hypothetical protein